MTKPDDVPQDVWDKVERSVVPMSILGSDVGHMTVINCCRAIMAAKAEEREANVAICVERSQRHHADVSQYPDDEQSRVLCFDSALEALDCAAAIRKRGEAD